MTAQEILTKLINMGIVHVIADEYFLTTKASELFSFDPKFDTENLKIPKTVPIGDLYPETIRNAAHSKKAEAVLFHCKVPVVAKNGGYCLHSIDAMARGVLDTVLKNSKMNPTLVLKVIEDYYSTVEYPKTFTKFLKERDLHSLYKWYSEGNSFESSELPDNVKWS